MDWGNGRLPFSEMRNYRTYQYDLIGQYIGIDILEVGTGDRSFTYQICREKPGIKRLLSIEPSTVLFNLPKPNYNFPDYVSFESLDLFEIDPSKTGLFDTIIFVNVLEHIEDNRGALEVAFSLLKK